MTDTKVLVKKRFAAAAAWHSWLEKHHAGSQGLWLEFAKKENERPSTTHSQALETALCFGWIDGQTKSSADGWWRQRFTPRGPRSKWSQVNCAAVERLRVQGKLTAAGLEQMGAAKSDGRWSAAYAPQRTIIVPDDLKAALGASPIARKFFESLDSKNRYAILYRLHNAKKLRLARGDCQSSFNCSKQARRCTSARVNSYTAQFRNEPVRTVNGFWEERPVIRLIV
jgi:uncharacterized protein YdeI (YjbR/CyaY-like superfamily)